MFVSLGGDLQGPIDDRLHNVGIHPSCRGLSCFFSFLKSGLLEKSQTMTGCARFESATLWGPCVLFYVWQGIEKVRSVKGLRNVPTSSTFQGPCVIFYLSKGD